VLTGTRKANRDTHNLVFTENPVCGTVIKGKSMSHNIIVEPNNEDENDGQEDRQAETQEAAESQVPEKYKGKTLEQVIEMHQNAEKKIGQQANEVGTYRELVSSLSEVKRVKDLDESSDTAEKPVEISTDDLWDKPGEAIAGVVKSVLKEELAPLREEQVATSRNNSVQQLMSDFPDAEQVGATQEFQDFVSRSPYRMNDAQKWVETQDVEAARRLLSDYKEFAGTALVTEEVEEVKPNLEAARKATTESGRGSAGAVSGKKVLRRSEVSKIIATDRARYNSDSFQGELLEAIRDGRFIED
jgi:hypothetical protein